MPTPVQPTVAPTDTAAPTSTNTATATPEPTSTPTPVPTYTLSGTVFFDYNGNGLRDQREPPIEEAPIRVAGLSTTSGPDGSYSLAGVPAGRQQVYVESPTQEPATAFRYINRFLGWVDIPAYEMNGVSVPAQHLADTDLQPIDQPLRVTLSGDHMLDVALMQGLLTLPFRRQEADLYWVNVYFDLDVERDVTRIFSGEVPYSYAQDQHGGIDYWGPQGLFVVSPAPADVYSLTGANSGGNRSKMVNLSYFNDGTFELMGNLAHLDQFVVEPGHVRRGQIVGTNGSTGTGDEFIPHIHFGLMDGNTRNEDNWPAVLDPYTDMVHGDPLFERYNWTPYEIRPFVLVGGPGFWTKCNDPQHAF